MPNKGGQDNALKRQGDKEHLATANQGTLPKSNSTNVTNDSFIQTKIFGDASSNLEIPGYSNSQLNGKGYTYNKLPYERFDDNQDNILHKNGAYDSNKFSNRPQS